MGKKWANPSGDSHEETGQKGKRREERNRRNPHHNPQFSAVFSVKIMVDATGIEPVTPAV